MTKAEVAALNKFYHEEYPCVQMALASHFIGKNTYDFQKKAIVRMHWDDKTVKITFFDSIKEAARAMEEEGKGKAEDNAKNIKKCINGQRGTACGFVWNLITAY